MKRAFVLVGLGLIGFGCQKPLSHPAPVVKSVATVQKPALIAGPPMIGYFRGDEARNSPGVGPMPRGHVVELWRTPVVGVTEHHWSGVGWTGQPDIVEWPPETAKWMNFKGDPPKTELIIGTLAGKVMFLNAETGKPSREPLIMPAPYPIKGTVTVDPRGYPLLGVGCGVDVGKPGYRLFSLLDFHEILKLDPYEKPALRKWAGSDGNGLILDDHFLLPSENGVFYDIALNSSWSSQSGQFDISPKVKKIPMSRAGMESSMAIFRDFGYFNDNDGTIFRVNLKDRTKFKKIFDTGDDSDSTIVFDSMGSFYTGCELDKRPKGKAAVFKIRAKDSKLLWKWEFECGTSRGEHPVNGGILSTGALDEASHSIFYTTSHHPRFGQGYLVALNTDTGHLKWKVKLNAFAWSSPIVLDGLVFCADSTGSAFLLDSASGKTALTDEKGAPIDFLSLGSNAEGSPVVWKGRIFVGLRGGAIVCLGIAKDRPTS